MDYPKREKFFAHKFTRLMFRVCLANDIGPAACYMLSQIAHTEDASHYRKSVTFYNDQLINVCGLGSVPSLIRARSKAIEAGWLQYTPGKKGKAGSYHVTIPEWANGLPDGSVEHDFPSAFTNESLPQAERNRSETVVKAEGNRSESVNHSSLSLNPDPNPVPEEKSAASRRQPKRLAATNGYTPDFDAFWTAYPEGRRKNKPGTFAAFQAALSATDAATLISRAGDYAASWEGQSQYVRGPTPWLNQQAWNDPAEAWREQRRSKAADHEAELKQAGESWLAKREGFNGEPRGDCPDRPGLLLDLREAGPDRDGA